MTTQQLDPFYENRIRPDIKEMLEYHILEGLPLKEACRRAGLPYHKNVSQHKFSKAGRAYVAQLKRRRRVIVEYGVDEPCLATLIEIRDEALKNGSHVAAVRAEELCLRAAKEAKADGKGVGGKKDVDEMTRAEMLAEIQEIKLKADGKDFDLVEDPRDAEFWESVRRTK
ncbi:MAG: hypothetical protein HOE85_14350 [Nitrospinaceae bacterium]|jgi:hypothetical protein|nr:hypothetical protein [Nitrospinaceae bacterium]MBT7857945.1 hypothetical protein [Nitrospinaceae bacterium]